MRTIISVGSGLAAVLLMPAAAMAAASDRVTFTVKPKIVTQLIASKPGERRYRVLSNAPFKITASGIIGPVRARVSKIGVKAQSPGPKQMCRLATGVMSSIIYRAKRKTASLPGRPMSQSIVVTLRYDKSIKPKFRFKPRKTSAQPLAQRCMSVDSPPLAP